MSLSFLLTAAHAAPAYSQNAGPAIPWARIVLAFFFCIAFAVVAILWLRSRQGQPVDVRALLGKLGQPTTVEAEEPLEIERRLRVSPASQIVVLRCGVRRYLLHVGSQGAQNLDRLDDVPPTGGTVS